MSKGNSTTWLKDRYKGVYDGGPYELRDRRLARMKQLGIIAEDVIAHDVVAPEISEWSDFSAYKKNCSVRAMEAYAGMVDQMDHEIGRVIDYLKKSGQYDNTLIVFMSDNGAEGHA